MAQDPEPERGDSRGGGAEAFTFFAFMLTQAASVGCAGWLCYKLWSGYRLVGWWLPFKLLAVGALFAISYPIISVLLTRTIADFLVAAAGARRVRR